MLMVGNLRSKLLFSPLLNGPVFGLSSLSFVDSAISDTQDVVIPAGAAVGDLAILLDWASEGGTPTDVVPTNFTGIGQASNANARVRASYKVLVGGDPGATITGMNATGNEPKVMFVFRPNATINTVTLSTVNAQQTTANPTLQTVSASGQPTPLVVIGGAGCTSGAPVFSTASPAFDATVVNSDDHLRGGYKVYNSSPADHSIDMNDLGNNGLISFYLRVS